MKELFLTLPNLSIFPLNPQLFPLDLLLLFLILRIKIIHNLGNLLYYLFFLFLKIFSKFLLPLFFNYYILAYIYIFILTFFIIKSIPEELSLELIQSFLSKYRHHCQCLVDSTYHHQFYEIEKYLLNFWGKLHPQYKMLLRYPQIIALINEKDHIAYTVNSPILFFFNLF